MTILNNVKIVATRFSLQIVHKPDLDFIRVDKIHFAIKKRPCISMKFQSNVELKHNVNLKGRLSYVGFLMDFEFTGQRIKLETVSRNPFAYLFTVYIIIFPFSFQYLINLLTLGNYYKVLFLKRIKVMDTE